MTESTDCAAIALEPGISMVEWMGGGFPPAWIRSSDGLAVKAGDAEQSIFSGVGPVLTAEAVKRLNWQGMRAFTEKLRAAPTDVPLTYLVATEDPALPPAVQELWAAHAAHSLRIPSGPRRTSRTPRRWQTFSRKRSHASNGEDLRAPPNAKPADRARAPGA